MTDDQGEPLAGVEIQLHKPDGTVVAATLTGSNGAYTFPEVEPDTHVLVEKNPTGYPGDVSDYDSVTDGDAGEDVVNADLTQKALKMLELRRIAVTGLTTGTSMKCLTIRTSPPLTN